MLGAGILRSDRWRPAWLGALVTILSGFLVWVVLPGQGMVRLSYDLGFLFGRGERAEDVVVVVMDEAAHAELHQAYGRPWDRALHARLLNKLAADRARAVVFDIAFVGEGPSPEADAMLLEALRGAPPAFLASIWEESSLPGVEGGGVTLPWEEFIEAVGESHCGLGEVTPDADGVVRRHFRGWLDVKSLAVVAAEGTGAAAWPLAEANEQRWLRYYGPSDSGSRPFQKLSYHTALGLGPGYFLGKTVFVGSASLTGFVGEEKDEYGTPFTRWTGQYSSGVEVQATAYLNLVRRDWLTRWPVVWESGLVVFLGAVFGGGLALLRPGWSVLAGLGGSLVLFVLGVGLPWWTGQWFGWGIPAGVQVPVGVFFSVIGYARRMTMENRALATELGTSREAFTRSRGRHGGGDGPASNGTGITIPDYSLLRLVGEGAYGEVWLVRDAVGTLRAAKIVYRSRLPKEEIYEREFRGISNYMPLSLNHPALLHVLHAGRNDEAGYYYCIMEAGDDEKRREQIIPEDYQPQDLARELDRRGRFPVVESARLGLHLSSALEYLHEHGLMHRDIKPSNIIFVQGRPKLADIGLVSRFDVNSRDLPSQVGTLVYMAPEGPMAPGSDIYGVGKVLYEMSTGLDPRRFPELPAELMVGGDAKVFGGLNRILLRCCEVERSRRYASGKELREALESFLQGLGARPG